MVLDGDDYLVFELVLWQSCYGLLVFGPESGGDGFLYAFKRFFLVFALRYTSRQGGDFGHYPAVFGLF